MNYERTLKITHNANVGKSRRKVSTTTRHRPSESATKESDARSNSNSSNYRCWIPRKKKLSAALSWFLNNIDPQELHTKILENSNKRRRKKKTRQRLGSRCSEQEAKRCKKKWHKNTLQQVVNTSYYYSFFWNLSVKLLAVLLLLLPRSRTSAESYPTEARSARAPSQKLMQQGESLLLHASETELAASSCWYPPVTIRLLVLVGYQRLRVRCVRVNLSLSAELMLVVLPAGYQWIRVPACYRLLRVCDSSPFPERNARGSTRRLPGPIESCRLPASPVITLVLAFPPER